MADDPQSPVTLNRQKNVAYHKVDGRKEFHYPIDAMHAVNQHPDEWAFEPWGSGEPHPSANVVISADWRDFSTAQRRALAIKLGAPPTVKAIEADDLIEQEEKRRASLQEPETPERDPRIDAVEIPEDWRNLSAKERRELAIELGAPQDVNTPEADNHILVEVQHRTGTQASEKTPL